MNNLACRAAWVLHQRRLFPVCRIIAGRRFPQATRSFRSSQHLKAPNDDPSDAAKPSWNHIKDQPDTQPVEGIPFLKPDEVIDNTDAAADPPRKAGQEVPPAAIEGSQEKPTKLKDRGKYGSALRRAGRHSKSGRELSVTLPAWFLERNVLLFKEGSFPGVRHLGLYDPEKHVSQADKPLEGDAAQSVAGKGSFESDGCLEKPTLPESTLPSVTSDYYIHKSVMAEIGNMVSAGLQLPAARHADSYAASRPHLLLQCPKDGGIVFLDTVVQFAAACNQADLVSLDAQDIAEVAGDNAADLPDWPIDSVRSLGYDTHLMMAHRDSFSTSEATTDEMDDDEGDDDDVPRGLPESHLKTRVAVMPTIAFVGSAKLSELFNSGKVNNHLQFSERESASATESAGRYSSNPDPSIDTRVDLLLEAFVDAALAKHRAHQSSGHPTNAEETSSGTSLSPEAEINDWYEGLNAGQKNLSRPLIIQVKDYAEINATATGGPLLERLFEIVGRRRREGQRVLIIGTTSSQDLVPSLSKSGFKSLQTEHGQGSYRVIVTPCEPASASAPGGALERCQKGRTFCINIRHLQGMLRRLASSQQRVGDFVSLPAFRVELDSTTIFVSGLEEEIWSFDRVHQAAMMVLGLLKKGEELKTRLVMSALRMLDASDNAKFDWIRRHKYDGNTLAVAGVDDPSKAVDGTLSLFFRYQKVRLTAQPCSNGPYPEACGRPDEEATKILQ